MIKKIEQIFGALRGVSLSTREKATMRLHLQAHMRENPLRSSFGARIVAMIADASESIGEALNSQTFLAHPAFAACVLVLCIGLGTSYASESALPGQALYSFKIRVNEPLQGVFATTPQAKAEWSAELTDRRLQEAEELAATNQLSPVATADIEKGLDGALQDFNSSVTLLSKGDGVEASNVQSNLEASLNAHEVVLATLPTSQAKNATRITSLVRKHAAHISKERSLSDAVLTATDSAVVHTAALSQQRFAQDAVDQTQILSEDDTLDTQVASSVSAITHAASSDIQAGNSDAKGGHWGKAYGAFQDAVRKVKETQDSIDTRKWLKERFNVGFNVAASSTATTTLDEDFSNSDDSSSGTDVSDPPQD